MSKSIFEKLNSEQLLAVNNNNGAQLLLAGAGSGKTLTMTAKYIKLLENGFNPQNILALTFSNKASNEMKHRILKELEHLNFSFNNNDLHISTFHSFASKLLRKYGNKVGIKNNYIIIDENDADKLIEEVLEEYPRTTFQLLKQYIQNIYNQTEENNIKIEFHELFEYYHSKLKEKNVLDFGSLLYYSLKILKNNDIALSIENNFHYILIDEFQDTNKCQFEIIKSIRKKNKNLCCVGDADQSIYGWRGADIDNILQFEQSFPNYVLYKLEQNYRSHSNIVAIANELISKNIFRKDKKMVSNSPAVNRIVVQNYYSPKNEAQEIVKKIHAFSKKNETVAVLYRNNALSRDFEESLRMLGLNYTIMGGFSFYERKEIKDIASYLKLIYNDNDLCFERIINTPKRSIGKSKIDDIKDFSIKHNISMYDTIQHESFLSQKGMSKKCKDELIKFVKIINKAKNEKNLYIALKNLIDEIKYFDYLDEHFNEEDAFDKKQNINSLLESLENEQDINTFLDNFALDPNSHQSMKKNEKIVLSTIHASKGLEFDHVFIVGVEEDILPSKYSKQGSMKLIEEERRLFYVAITRAKISLQISYTNQRYLFGRAESLSPSRFLRDLPNIHIDFF